MCLLFSDHVCTDPGQLAFVFLPSRGGGGGGGRMQKVERQVALDLGTVTFFWSKLLPTT